MQIIVNSNQFFCHFRCEYQKRQTYEEFHLAIYCCALIHPKVLRNSEKYDEEKKEIMHMIELWDKISKDAYFISGRGFKHHRVPPFANGTSDEAKRQLKEIFRNRSLTKEQINEKVQEWVKSQDSAVQVVLIVLYNSIIWRDRRILRITMPWKPNNK